MLGTTLSLSKGRGAGEKTLELGLRDPVVTTSSLHGTQRPFINPLFERGVTDTEAPGCVARADQFIRHPASKPVELDSKIGWYHSEPLMNITRLWALGFGVWAALASAQALPAVPLIVFAASDLGPAFKQIVPQFERQTRSVVTLVLGSTGMLAQQIRNGAPADVFFAANESFIDELAKENLTLRQTHILYARGRIAMVALGSGNIRFNELNDLADARIRRIAIANPQHAPYGLAARQALESDRKSVV